MLDEETVADVQGDADALLRGWGFETDDLPDLVAAVRKETGRGPQIVRMSLEARLQDVNGRPTVFVRRGIIPGRLRWLLGHELAEIHYRRVGYRGDDIEDRCNALGAALAVPRLVYLSARRTHGTNIARLAKALQTTQSVALLREAEASGAPRVLVRDAGPIVRGEPFVWPVKLELRAIERARGLVVRIRDEARRAGLRAALLRRRLLLRFLG